MDAPPDVRPPRQTHFSPLRLRSAVFWLALLGFLLLCYTLLISFYAFADPALPVMSMGQGIAMATLYALISAGWMSLSMVYRYRALAQGLFFGWLCFIFSLVLFGCTGLGRLLPH
jgi:hypothetical protein